ncbi:MAG: hypothetical protein ABIH20_00670 [Candidatus Diapherotrites archaeon]
MGLVFKALVDSLLIMTAFYVFVLALPLFGIGIFHAATFSWMGVLVTYMLVNGEVFWNRV